MIVSGSSKETRLLHYSILAKTLRTVLTRRATFYCTLCCTKYRTSNVQFWLLPNEVRVLFEPAGHRFREATFSTNSLTKSDWST